MADTFGLHFYPTTTEKCVEKLKTHHVLLTEDTKKTFIRHSERHRNILIEGENLHALKALTYTHAGKIDVVGIDPPYNTGNKDFVYNDKFSDEEDKLAYVGDDDGWRHTKWLSFMEARLTLARTLMSERGVIYVHIDDNEQHHLRCLMDKVFGENNFLANLIWKKKFNGGYDAQFITTEHEYILVYAKNKDTASLNTVPFNVEDDKAYKSEDEHLTVRGRFKVMNLDDKSLKYSASLDFAIQAPDGSQIEPENCWRWGKDKVEWGMKNGFLSIIKDKDKWRVNKKQYQYCDNDGEPLIRAYPLRSIIDGISNTTSSNEIKDLFGDKSIFQYAKPVELIKRLLFVSSQKDSIILDFFAGSGTTGQAVAELNKEDGGTRQFILITNNDKSEKLPQGICSEVTYPRLHKTIGDENLQCFKASTIKKDGKFEGDHIDQLVEGNKLLPILKLKYGTFDLVEETKQYSIFLNHDKTFCLGVWHVGIGAEAKKFRLKLTDICPNNETLVCRDTTYPQDYYRVLNRK